MPLHLWQKFNLLPQLQRRFPPVTAIYVDFSVKILVERYEICLNYNGQPLYLKCKSCTITVIQSATIKNYVNQKHDNMTANMLTILYHIHTK